MSARILVLGPRVKVLLLVCTLACVGWLGHWSGRRLAPPSAPTATTDSALVERQQQGSYVTHEELGTLRAEMRTEFRGLAQSLTALQRPTSATEPVPASSAEAAGEAEAPPNANQVHEYDKTKSLIQDALRTGTWRDEDRRSFRAGLSTLPDSLRNEVISQLMVAINSDRVRPTYAGPPF